MNKAEVAQYGIASSERTLQYRAESIERTGRTLIERIERTLATLKDESMPIMDRARHLNGNGELQGAALDFDREISVLYHGAEAHHDLTMIIERVLATDVEEVR